MIAVAAVSARLMAQCAAAEGWRVAALDIFGDADTRAVAAQWLPIGDAPGMRTDADALLAVLRVLAREGQAEGWVAGAGFEATPRALHEGAAVLPLWGTAAADVARLAHAREFFAALDEAGLPHPQVAFGACTPGMLIKQRGGCGGAHIRIATAPQALDDGGYAQAHCGGQPMSATFIANGRQGVLLGMNVQDVREHAGAPYVFHGVTGPVDVSDGVGRTLRDALRVLVPRFGLRGLGSIDFLLHEGQAWLLEVNARPPASLALYPRVGGIGIMTAHVQACREAVLPLQPLPARAAAPVRGTEIVFAPHDLCCTARLAAALAALPGVHDRPLPGTAIAKGQPLCSCAAAADSAAAVRRQLAARREAVLNMLRPPAPSPENPGP